MISGQIKPWRPSTSSTFSVVTSPVVIVRSVGVGIIQTGSHFGILRHQLRVVAFPPSRVPFLDGVPDFGDALDVGNVQMLHLAAFVLHHVQDFVPVAPVPEGTGQRDVLNRQAVEVWRRFCVS